MTINHGDFGRVDTNAEWLRAVVETAVDGVILIDAQANGRLQNGSLILSKPYRKAELVRRLREALSAPLDGAQAT